MATVRLASNTASGLADLITTLVSAGAAAGTAKVYTGTLDTALDPTGDTLLATFTLVDPAAAAALAGVATWDFDPDISATVAATDTAGWFVVADSDGNAVFGGTVGATGSGMVLTFPSVSWTVGGTVLLVSGSVTAPQA